MPAPYAIADFAAAIPSVLSDSGYKLYPKPTGNAVTDAAAQAAVLTPFVARAIERYSKDAPLENVSDVTSDGTMYLPLPVYADVNAGVATPVFDPTSSNIISIQRAFDTDGNDYLDESDYRLYRSPAGYTIQLGCYQPNPGEQLRVTWTARHALDGSTVVDGDFLALVDLAASFAAEYIGTLYAQSMMPTMQADNVNWGNKRSEYQAIAGALRKRYFNHLGVAEAGNGEASVGAAIALGHTYEDMQSGVGRLVHNKYSR